MNQPTSGSVLVRWEGVISRCPKANDLPGLESFEFLPGALEGLRLFAEKHWRVLAMLTEQSLTGGSPGPAELYKLTKRMLLEIALAGGYVHSVHYNMPSGSTVGGWFTSNTAHLFQRIMSEHHCVPEQTYLITGSPQDREAAAVAGLDIILVRRDAFLSASLPQASGVVSNLYEAAERILRPNQSPDKNNLVLQASQAGMELLLTLHLVKGLGHGGQCPD